MSPGSLKNDWKNHLSRTQEEETITDCCWQILYSTAFLLRNRSHLQTDRAKKCSL